MSRDQLRVYSVKPGAMASWVREWQAGIRPLRERFGFVILGPWIAEEQNQFIWILRHPGPGSFEAADQAYYASADRTSLDPDPARHLAKTDDWLMTPLT